ncbi:O-antigen ligase, partial [uncultured Clostridium sp.]|uniref:O-antigen ligase family protein n=1 Tax=uncultured Clostridium sp. TaxID=59620 RepID=UPI0025F488E1
TRSGWLSVILFMIVMLFFIRGKKEYLKRFFNIIMIFMAIVLVINISLNGVISSRSDKFKNEVVEFNEHSGSNRVKIWKSVIICIKKHPILGTGPDTVFEALRKEKSKNPNIINAAVDKAHNEFLQIALNSGIPSLCLYIVFLILVIINILKNIYDYKYKILLLVFLSFIIQSFFNISVISVAPIMWILFGIMSKDEIIIYNM